MKLRLPWHLALIVVSMLFASVSTDTSSVGADYVWHQSGHTSIVRPTSYLEAVPPPPATQVTPAEEFIENGRTLQPEECCYCLESPGTLFQWSYGNSFSGGPDLDEPLVTDRPDFTEASSTVGKGVSQVEFGYTYIYNSDDGVSERTQSLGEPLLRYGVFANWLELRINLFPVDQRTTMAGRSNSTAGTEDLYLGAKIGLTPQEGMLPEMALIPQMFVPTGSNAFNNEQVLPGVNWIYGWELTDRISMAGSTQINRRIDSVTGQAFSRIAQSWTFGFSLTDKLGAYTEWFVRAPHGADTEGTPHVFNAGFTYLINDDIQFDIRYGKGLNHVAADYFVGTGLSIRFK